MCKLRTLFVALSVTIATSPVAAGGQPSTETAWHIGWPCWSGPHTNFSGVPSGSQLADDLDDARLLWKSEEIIPVGKAHNPGSSSRGARGKPSGGGASPIVADGLVYLWYFQPAGNVVDRDRFEAAKENGRYGGPHADPLTWWTGADEVVVAIANGHVSARVKNDVGESKPGAARGVCIELATGRLKGEFTAPFGGADCSTIVADGRVLADADGSHNGTQLYLANADPQKIESLGAGEAWQPPHVTTTAYHSAMTHTYVAGRLFIRGQNHVCCYDVREASP